MLHGIWRRSRGKVFLTASAVLAAGTLWAQGLNTQASKDDWEEINFEFNSSVLTDGFPSLLRLADLLKQNTDYKVKLQGHTDSVGSRDYNQKLAQRRAETVKMFLEKYGAAARQIEVASQGKNMPKVDNRTKDGRFMNRRVELSVYDGQGKLVGAGGVGDAIRAMKAAEDCCKDILKRLDQLDEIARLLRDLKNDNANLRKELDDMKGAARTAQADMSKDVKDAISGLPKPLSGQEIQEIATRSATDVVDKTRMPRFSLLGVNLGSDDRGRVTFTGRGRYFAPFHNNFALQAQAEYMYFRDRQEGQLDFGLVNRIKNFQGGLFTSFKNVNLRNLELDGRRDISGNGTLGQAAVTFDYLFKQGRVGLFGTKAFLDNAVIRREALTRTLSIETYLKAVDQVGASTTLGIYKNAYVEGNLGYLKSFGHADRPGGTLRFVFPINDNWAFTVEGGVNETLVGRGNNGRAVFGIQWGNLLRPKEFVGLKHPVPVDIPRVRYEVLTRSVRTGNEPPIADAGPDQIGVNAGNITLDGSASTDPEGDPITFAWQQTGGPAVSLAGANTARATFTAGEGQTYTFRLTVTDDKGASAVARVTVTTARAATVRILRFLASPVQIRSGQSSTLTWQVENAETVTIDGVGNVDPRSGSTSVSPEQTTTYRLTARNRQGEVSETVTVTVERPEVRILFFQASPMNVAAGGSSTLNWQTENADEVTISGVGTVARGGNAVVTPAQTTTYTLTARNRFGSTTAQVTIQVTAAPMPRIVRFTAAPTEILVGENASLVWQVEDATDVSISGIGTVALTGTTTVSPNATTTYVLTARNASGEVTAETVVTVIPQVRIINFTANPSTSPRPGAPVTLSWSTENATDISIDGIGSVQGAGTVVVNPQSDTTYTLRAFGRRSQTNAQVTVRVTPAAPVDGGPIANAGPDQVTTNREIKLDGSRSTSPEGLVIGFSWRAIGRQPELILGADTATPTVRFANLAFGEYVFELTVTDSRGRFARSTTKVFFGAY